jgi:hypothetical protein
VREDQRRRRCHLPWHRRSSCWQRAAEQLGGRRNTTRLATSRLESSCVSPGSSSRCSAPASLTVSVALLARSVLHGPVTSDTLAASVARARERPRLTMTPPPANSQHSLASGHATSATRTAAVFRAIESACATEARAETHASSSKARAICLAPSATACTSGNGHLNRCSEHVRPRRSVLHERASHKARLDMGETGSFVCAGAPWISSFERLQHARLRRPVGRRSLRSARLADHEARRHPGCLPQPARRAAFVRRRGVTFTRVNNLAAADTWLAFCGRPALDTSASVILV